MANFTKNNFPLKSNICPMCGLECGFTPRKDRINSTRFRKFCSTSCSLKFRHKNKIIYIKCPVCGKQFRKNNPKDGVARKHCSIECYNKIRKINLPKYSYPKKEKKNYQTKKIQGKVILKHRWVMEQHLGRKLSRHEVVHHIDGDRHNNNIENLMVMTQSEHLKLEQQNWKKNSQSP